MKILQEGAKETHMPWWVGRKLSCGCGMVLELEASDVTYPNVYINANELFLACPGCGDFIGCWREKHDRNELLQDEKLRRTQAHFHAVLQKCIKIFDVEPRQVVPGLSEQQTQ